MSVLYDVGCQQVVMLSFKSCPSHLLFLDTCLSYTVLHTYSHTKLSNNSYSATVPVFSSFQRILCHARRVGIGCWARMCWLHTASSRRSSGVYIDCRSSGAVNTRWHDVLSTVPWFPSHCRRAMPAYVPHSLLMPQQVIFGPIPRGFWRATVTFRWHSTSRRHQTSAGNDCMVWSLQARRVCGSWGGTVGALPDPGDMLLQDALSVVICFAVCHHGMQQHRCERISLDGGRIHSARTRDWWAHRRLQHMSRITNLQHTRHTNVLCHLLPTTLDPLFNTIVRFPRWLWWADRCTFQLIVN